MSLEGRVALVTGGGRGIGKAISLALAEDGADIAVNYRKDEDSARATVAEVKSLGHLQAKDLAIKRNRSLQARDV